MLNDVTISLDLAQLLGGDIDTRRTRVYVSTNVPNNTLIDTSTGQIRLGDEKVTVETDGTGSFTTWGVGADGNPTSWQTTVTVEYARVGNRDRQVRTFGPFTITDADDGKNLAELEDQQAIPPNYQTAFTADMEAIRDETQTIRDGIVGDLGTTDSQTATLINSPGSLTETALSASTALLAGAHVSVKSAPYNATGDGTTDDTAAIQAAIDAATAFGAAVFFPQGRYRLRSEVTFAGTNVRLFGEGRGVSVIVAFGQTSVLNRMFTNDGDVIGLTVAGLSFEGTVTDDVTDPRRSRTSTSNGFNSALQVSGDLAPTGTHEVRDVRIIDCEVRGSHGLPMLLSGVRGESRVESCRSYLTLDWGWTWCEQAICVNSSAYKSADNGFSISRGCQSVVAVGNTVENAAYWGIWVAGFDVSGTSDDHGPSSIVVVGNTLKTLGYGGVCADEAPTNATIAGNHIEDVRRGPTDQLTNIRGVAVLVGGFPADTRTAPTAFAEGISVTSNTMIDCARGGVLVQGAKNILVSDNLILRPGSQYLADGVTAIASTDTDNNFGVAVMTGATSTVTRLTVVDNVMIDDRSTAYMNYAWYTTGSTSPYVNANRDHGSRQSANLTHDNTVQTHSGVHTWTANGKFTAGATAGATAATGNIAGWDINGAAGSARLLSKVLTGGANRWIVRGSGDAESGSNVGTRYQISRYDDAGTLIGHMIELTRDGKLGFAGAAPVTPPALGVAATDAATTQALVNTIRSALISLGLATA